MKTIYLDSGFHFHLINDDTMQDLDKLGLLIEDLYNVDLEAIR